MTKGADAYIIICHIISLTQLAHLVKPKTTTWCLVPLDNFSLILSIGNVLVSLLVFILTYTHTHTSVSAFLRLHSLHPLYTLC